MAHRLNYRQPELSKQRIVMQAQRKLITATILLTLGLLPMVAAVSPNVATTTRDTATSVAIAQPLAGVEGAPLVSITSQQPGHPVLPEPGMLVLVGSALIGLAAFVRRST